MVADMPVYYAQIAWYSAATLCYGRDTFGRNHNGSLNFLMADGHVENHRRVIPATETDVANLGFIGGSWQFKEYPDGPWRDL